jgi:Family of unknown function (DUF6502)
MPKERQKRRTLAPTREKLKTEDLKEVSPDDVIEQLHALLDHFGAHSRRPAARTPPTSNSATSKRLYPHAAALGELLTAWHQDPSFLDGTGRPLPLKLKGVRPSFASLAKKSVPRADPQRLLSELRRVGAVATDSSNLIRVQMRSLPVYGDRQLAMQYTLTSLHTFIKTLRHNLSSAPSNSNQLFHRVAINGTFDVRDMPALKVRVKRHAQSFLELMDNWMARRPATRKRISKSAGSQVAIGVYLSVDRD